jgi:hypothetical protein
MSMYLDSTQVMSWAPHDKGIVLTRKDSNEGNYQNSSSQNHMDRSENQSGDEAKHGAGNTKWYQRMSCSSCCSPAREQQQIDRISPYALYSNEELSPRSSLWVYLAAASLAGLATVLVVEQPVHNTEERNGADTVLVSILSTSFVLSLVIAVSYRHRILRNYLTQCVLPHTTVEVLSALVIFILWCIELRYVMDPFSGVQYGQTLMNENWGQHYYDEVWNANLWASSWLGGAIAASLVGELLMARDDKRRGVVVRSDGICLTRKSNDNEQLSEKEYIRTYALDEDGSKHWFLMLVISCALSAFCINYRIGMSCDGSLSSTPFCKRCVLGSVVGIVCTIISVGALVVHFMNLREQAQSNKKLWVSESSFAALSFILNCMNVGFVTSPGGPGADIGNIFLTAWLALIVSTVLCERVAKSWALRVIKLQGAEHSGDKHTYPKEEHPREQEQHTNINFKKGNTSTGSPKKRREHTQYNENADTSPGNNTTGPRREFISAANRKKSSSSDSRSSSSSSSSSSTSGSFANSKNVQRMDTSGDHTSGENTTSTFSLPAPPPICLDSSSDDHHLSRPSLSQSLNSINGGPSSPHAISKNGPAYSVPPPLPYNAYGFSYGLENPVDQTDEVSIEENQDDDNDSAIEICVDYPDDVSSLGISMLSLGNSGHSNVDPDGYKSEDNYKESPRSSKSKPTSKRASRVKRLQSTDELPTVEERSLSTRSMVESSTADDTTEQIMNLGRKLEDGPFNRHDSGNASSVGPITVDESVSYAV